MIEVIATLRAREGKEDRLRDILLALVVESRQEKGNVRYDLLVGLDDPRDLALHEVWENEATLNAHLRSKHIATAYTFADELNEFPPRVISYTVLEPTRKTHSAGPTRRLEPSDPQP
jgi:quinol monooxygenase YgiN